MMSWEQVLELADDTISMHTDDLPGKVPAVITAGFNTTLINQYLVNTASTDLPENADGAVVFGSVSVQAKSPAMEQPLAERAL